ncbi:MAG TPA: hypothetical protein VN367_02745 [Chlorobaculum sp.]|nr:hypothetical protein [Chlorobaculum sp.]
MSLFRKLSFFMNGSFSRKALLAHALPCFAIGRRVPYDLDMLISIVDEVWQALQQLYDQGIKVMDAVANA